jgi:GTP cyclohydrolase IB
MDTSLTLHPDLPDGLPVEDVQSRIDTRRQPIDRVGIKDILHLVRIRDRAQGEQHTLARFDMTVDLPQDFKGTHMSRFVEILNRHEYAISVKSFQNMLVEMTGRLEASSGGIAMRFPYFVEKTAPVTGVKSLVDYQVSFPGEIRERQATPGCGSSCRSPASAPARKPFPHGAPTTRARMSRSP